MVMSLPGSNNQPHDCVLSGIIGLLTWFSCVCQSYRYQMNINYKRFVIYYSQMFDGKNCLLEIIQ